MQSIPREGPPNIDDIEILRWPVKSATIEVRDVQGLLATASSGPLDNAGDTFEIYVRFPQSVLNRFVEGERSGRLSFVFHWQFRNLTGSSVRLNLDAFSLASQQLELSLAARANFGPDRVGHHDLNELKEVAERSVRATLYADDPAIAERLFNSVGKLIEGALSAAFNKEAPFSLNVNDMKSASENDRAALRKYFEPVLQDKSTEKFVYVNEEDIKKHFESQTDRKEIERINLVIPIGETSTGASQALGIDLAGGLGNKTVEERFHEFVSKYGITWKQVGNEKWLRIATSVDVYRFNRAEWRSKGGTLAEYFIGRSVEQRSVTTPAVKASYVVDLGDADQRHALAKLVKNPSKISLWPFGGMQLGMCVPYFGKYLPEGYVWADGQSFWPNEEWVPDYLRGKPVPNLNGRVLRGCRNGIQLLGEEGGADSHRHPLPSHEHDLSNRMTGQISHLIPDGIRNKYYKVVREDGQSLDGEFLVTVRGEFKGITGKPPEGQHVHDLEGTTGGLSKTSPVYVEADDQAGVPGRSEQYVPSYVAVHYIIRVR